VTIGRPRLFPSTCEYVEKDVRGRQDPGRISSSVKAVSRDEEILTFAPHRPPDAPPLSGGIQEGHADSFADRPRSDKVNPTGRSRVHRREHPRSTSRTSRGRARSSGPRTRASTVSLSRSRTFEQQGKRTSTSFVGVQQRRDHDGRSGAAGGEPSGRHRRPHVRHFVRRSRSSSSNRAMRAAWASRSACFEPVKLDREDRGRASPRIVDKGILETSLHQESAPLRRATRRSRTRWSDPSAPSSAQRGPTVENLVKAEFRGA